MIGEVAHASDALHLLGDHRLHAFEHRLLAHRATVASAAHREIGGALFVVARIRDEAAVCGEHRVHLRRDDRLDLC